MGSSKYRYYLITRFNLRMRYTVTKDLAKIDVATDEKYLAERVNIFKKYTVPSIASQTSKDFEWIIFFDIHTPEQIKQQIESINKGYFRAFYLQDASEQNIVLNEVFHEHEVDFIATTRLDNDDAVNINFVQKVHETIQANELRNYAFGFENGIAYDLKHKIASKYCFPLNHFLTLVEPISDQTKCAFAYKHTEIDKYVQFDSIKEDFMWLELEHGKTISNNYMPAKFSTLVKDGALLGEKFGCEVEIKKGINNFFYMLFLLPINGIKLLKGYGFKTFFRKLKNKILTGYGE